MLFTSWLRNWKRSLERRWALHSSLRCKIVARRFSLRPRLEVLEDRWLLSAYVVDSAADTNTLGTLRYGINQANAVGSTITEIDFAIGTSGSAQTIDVGSSGLGALPTLTANGVFVNGLSQGGSGNTAQLITLDGTSAGSGADGLLLQGTGCIVSGLIVEDFSNNGIEVDGANNMIGGTATGAGNVLSENSSDGLSIDSGISGTQVQGNFIGTNLTGTAALANSIGVEVGGSGNTIGGTTAGAGNLISGNASDGVLIDSGVSGVLVLSNSIGTDITGANAVSNSNGVEDKGFSNTIGGAAHGVSNLISGNINDGVLIDGTTGDLVLGNYIGTNLTGTAILANSGNGIVADGSKDTIGGTTTAARNIISGNTDDGVLIGNSGVLVEGNYIGTDVTGNVALSNSYGVNASGSSNTIGGATTAARNVISGNISDGVYIGSVVSGVLVEGNFIGTNATGYTALANSGSGVDVFGNNNTVGGTTISARNLISANTNDGVLIESSASGVSVQGNYIGTDVLGANNLGNSNGVEVAGSGNTIGGTTTGARNLISANANDGVLVDSGASGVLVAGNYIGTNAGGALDTNLSGTALGNSVNGVEVAGNSNTIGGTTATSRNVVSGNSTDGVRIDSSVSGTQVQGNFIGTNAAGNSALANGTAGVDVYGNSNTIGGTAAGTRNLISGNTSYGVLIESAVSGVQVQGNYIGIGITGTAALPNSDGVYVQGSSNTVGGTASGAGNVISGNGIDGVYVGASGVSVLGNSIGTNPTGNSALANNNGIEVAASGNTIGGNTTAARNLISGNGNDGVLIDSGVTAVQVLGNYIGTNAAATGAVANVNGIEDQGANNIIGGTSSGAANLISGNTTDGVYLNGATEDLVLGNSIGTNPAGATALANGIGVEVAGVNNTIGGATTAASNLISGNSGDGIRIDSGASGVQVLGNSIGTDITGSFAVGNNNGVEVGGSNNTIGGTTTAARNLISGNSSDGVLIDAGASGVQVLGNYIGTDITGSVALANGNGVGDQGANNTIGGTSSGAGNLISGNTTDGVDLSVATGDLVLGNTVGTNAGGNKTLGNYDGIDVNGNNNTVGGTASGAGNLLSGNRWDGVLIDGGISGTLVQGNYIGTDITGNVAVGNTFYGIENEGASNTIGGVSGGGNLISGNHDAGVCLPGASSTTILGNSIGTNAAGASALGNLYGIEVGGDNTTISGDTLSGNMSDGVHFDGGFSGVIIQGNYIGTNAAGTAALPNGANGILISGPNNTIGGATSSVRNVISGNTNDGVLIQSSGVLVVGNYIGTDHTGDIALANNIGIEEQSTDNTLGGTTAGAGNLISGNASAGVQIDLNASGVAVQGNSIGSNAGGSSALGNGYGVLDEGASDIIGGTAAGAGNLISGNTVDGVYINGATGDSVQGNSIGISSAGNVALANYDGVEVSGSSNTIGSGNVISGNSNDGVQIDASTTGVLVQGSKIGTNAAGTGALANGYNGVEDYGSSNRIGSTASGAGNLISGNANFGVYLDGASSDLLLGNTIGLNSIGTGALANYNGVVVNGNTNTIGSGNVISGNTNDGVYIANVSGVLVQGSYIGTNVNGGGAVSNGNDGIEVAGSTNTIGGTTSAARNVVSGNTNDGILIDSGVSGTSVQGNYIGTKANGISAVANSGNGIEIQSSSNTIGGTTAGAGNAISGNSNDGILIANGVSGILVQGNRIGTGPGGGGPVANNGNGIAVAGSNNSIGGTASGAANLISGNLQDGILLVSGATGTSVLGNSIGTNVGGFAAVANGIDGIEVASSNNTIGGTISGSRNLISGNTKDGVFLESGSSGTLVQGNYVGTNVSGTKAVANSGNGVEASSSKNTIGGATSAARNLISGNSKDGVLIDSSASGTQVQGNYVGTNAAGSGAVANSSNGIEVAGNSNAIGGTASGAGNVVAGNVNDGILIDSGITGTDVLGNWVGNAPGTNAIANSGNGIEVAGDANTIGGTANGGLNIISGNSKDGVLIDSSAISNQVLGNRIGTGTGGGAAVANKSNGIEVAGNSNTIGGTASGSRNIISGNSKDGVLIDSSASGTLVQGNYIGITPSAVALGNGTYGVSIAGSNNSIGGSASGAGNTIADNKSGGVLVSAGSGNTISENSIYANGPSNSGPGITLSSGANNNLDAPILNSATLKNGTLTVTGTFAPPVANVPYVLEFFANPAGDPEGKIFLGSQTVTPTSTGSQSFSPFTTTNTSSLSSNPVVTATLTDSSGDTSIFSGGVVS